MRRSGTPYFLEVNPKIPPPLARLEELANNLWYSWDRATRGMFSRLHPALWGAVGHSPKVLLKRIDEKRLADAAADPLFFNNFSRVLSAYDSYHAEPTRPSGPGWLGQGDLVAYFCAEFGFHESLPIYSGGLGILAGDHCKGASDLRVPFVAVGLLYRQGYFYQTIDNEGNQRAEYHDSDFDDLPIQPVLKDGGAELHVEIELPGRKIAVKVWQVNVGHVMLYLLDTDIDANSERDRAIAHRLYGGDRATRLEQEIVLGAGGVRALAALGVKPTVWHINEGHAAFLVLERMHGMMRHGLDFEAALEAAAVNTVFTTHTAVPAGHDHFSEEMMRTYFEGYCRELGLAPEKLLELGRTPSSADFNMTALAVRGSRHQNGVSRIHGGVSSQILQDLWPQVPAEENPVDYVTNGVHVPTFLAGEWADVFDRFVGYDWAQQVGEDAAWTGVERVPDHVFWSTLQHLKTQMLHLVRYRVRRQYLRDQGSEAHLDRLFKLADPANPNVLTIGFGRRFATYKRASLLFENLDTLRQIVSDPKRPVLFIFAGKAHPADVPGQEFMRHIMHVARMPEFEGRILLVEGYDLRLARRLVSGVDVWLNNPVYPLEASGTSGMKAGMNGVLNLSILDGWWGEGYERDNGWAIRPASTALDQPRRNREEARTLYETLQDQVIPMYYRRGASGHSPEWIQMAKRSVASLMPRFNSSRMVHEYIAKFYLPASQKGALLAQNGFERATALAVWKARVRQAWPAVAVRRLDAPKRRIQFGDSMRLEVGVRLNGLKPADVTVELLLSHDSLEPDEPPVRHALVATGAVTAADEQVFALELAPELCGKLDYRIRAYPCHELLTHPFEMGLMFWA
jgi:starch phosphorylase